MIMTTGINGMNAHQEIKSPFAKHSYTIAHNMKGKMSDDIAERTENIRLIPYFFAAGKIWLTRDDIS
jgi:hypothetical protein